MSDTSQVFRPSEIAERLGVSGSTFRRYMTDFEAVVGRPLARDGHKRILTEGDVQTLTEANRLLSGGAVDSYRLGIARAVGLEIQVELQPLERQVSALLPIEVLQMPARLEQLVKVFEDISSLLQEQGELLKSQKQELANLYIQNEELRTVIDKAGRSLNPIPVDPERRVGFLDRFFRLGKTEKNSR